MKTNLLDVISLVNEEIQSKKIKVMKDENYAIFSYECKYSKPYYFKIKKTIALDDLFFEGVGLICGDGDKRFFGFTNTEFPIMNHFLEFSEKCLGIKRNYYKWRIMAPKSIDCNKTKDETSNELGLKPKNFSSFCFKENHRKPVVNVYRKTVLSNTIFSKIYESANQLVLTNRDYAAAYLRGLIASEGTVQLRNTTKSLFSVKISANDKEVRDFYRIIMDIVGIRYGKEEKDCIPIRDFENFLLMEKLDLLRISKLKQDKFSRGLEKLKVNKSFYIGSGVTKNRILEILRERQPLTVSEILIQLRKIRATQDKATLFKHLKELEKYGEIKKEGVKKFKGWPAYKSTLWRINLLQ